MSFLSYNPALSGYGTMRDGVPVAVALDDGQGSIQSRAISGEMLRARIGFDINVVGFTNDYDAFNFIRKHGEWVFCVTTDHLRPESFYEDRLVDDGIAIPDWAYPTSFGFFMRVMNDFCPEARWMRVTQNTRLAQVDAFRRWGARDRRILGDHDKWTMEPITRDLLRAYLAWTLQRSRFGIPTELRALADAEATITAHWRTACSRGLDPESPCPALITSALHAHGFETSEVLLRMSGYRVLALLQAPSLATGRAIVEIAQPDWGLPPRLALVREFEGEDPASGGWCWIATSCRSPYANTELQRGVYRVVRRATDWARARVLIQDVLSSRANFV